MLQAVVPNSAKPFNFQTAFGLSDEQVGSSHSFQEAGLVRGKRRFLTLRVNDELKHWKLLVSFLLFYFQSCPPSVLTDSPF